MEVEERGNENSLPLDIGNAIVQSFAEMEAAENALKRRPPSRPRTTFETLSAGKIFFEELQDDHYVDEQDYHAAEIY